MADQPTDELILQRRKDIVFDDPTLIGGMSDLADSLISVNVSLGMDLATQVTMEIYDPDFHMASSNYFRIGRDVYFKTSQFLSTTNMTGNMFLADHEYMHLEISSVACRPGPGSNPIWTVECRNKAVQQMRRDKEVAGSIKGTGHNFVIAAGQLYNIPVVAEPTTKTQKINKATNDRAADSTWDVISSLASDSKFVVFESEGIIFFGSQKWLLGKWGAAFKTVDPSYAKFFSETAGGANYCHMSYPSSSDEVFRLMQMPEVRRSDNDPLATQGSLSVDRSSGVALRAGMTIFLNNYPTMEGFYLISSVTYNHLGTDPVQVEFRSPEREEKEIENLARGASYRNDIVSRGF